MAQKDSTKKKQKLELMHELVPLHEKISEEEKQKLFSELSITIKELPKIMKDDPAIRHLEVSENDVIKITRKSSTAGKSVFYRGVVDE